VALRLTGWASRFQKVVQAGDIAGERLFHPECQWRDLVLLTWNIQTYEGCGAVFSALEEARPNVGELVLSPLDDAKAVVGEDWTSADGQVISGWLSVQTAAARGVARVALSPDGEGFDRCSGLFTSMTELVGHEEIIGFRRPLGHQLHAVHGRSKPAKVKDHPYVLIIGGGQSGLMLAARLKHLQVPTLVVEKLARPGDSWRRRYSSLHLHDVIWLCDMPYMPFPDHFPVYLSKDQYADWLDLYSEAMGLDFQGSTEVLKASYDPSSQQWSVQLQQEGSQIEILKPAHVVLATGNAGRPKTPTFVGMDNFLGKVLHSSQFPGCSVNAPDWQGQRCVVVGSNTSAHDISQDLWEHGSEVTMLQRSPGCVIKTGRMRELAAAGGYSEEARKKGVTIAACDLRGAATPYGLRIPDCKAWVERIKVDDAEFYAQLDDVGWRQTFGEDETGLYMMFLRTFRGYYFDIGASQLVADRKIKLQGGTSIAEVKPRSVVLDNGHELPCDVLVLATGYQNMSELVERLISPEVAQAIGPCWGLGSGVAGDEGPWEGELRNMWKPTAQPGLWFQGGNISLCRFHSLHLALQLKAKYEKIFDLAPAECSNF